MNTHSIDLDLELIRKRRPVIHHITNQVVKNVTANLTLAMGALPVMADEPKEVEDMVSGAQCLVLNIGTLDQRSLEAMVRAGLKANELGIPVILDPVGVGSTGFRRQGFKRLSDVRMEVIKGNYDEIRSLLEGERMRGVDSFADVELEERRELAKRASEEFGAVVAVTGREDVVASPEALGIVKNGSEMLKFVTGGGCMATSAVGVFLAVGEEPFFSALYGLSIFGLASELADKRGPGTLNYSLIDSIYELCLNFDRYREKVRIEWNSQAD